MPLQALPLQTKIITAVSSKIQDRLIEVNFGGGYKQTAPDGLQSASMSATITLAPLSEAEKDTIRQFMLDVGVTTGFTVNLPGYPTDMKVRRIPNKYSERIISKQESVYRYSITFDIVQHLENV